MMNKTIILIILTILFISCKKDNPISPNGNDIATVKIGSNFWTTKNLDVDHYRNGDPIPEVRDSATWVNLKTGAWCYYNNDPALGAIYGKLYNWFAVDDPRGLAPNGFRVATYPDWMELINLVSYENGIFPDWYTVRVWDLREPGTKYWSYDFVIPSTNKYGFSALPGGQRSKLKYRYLGVKPHFDQINEEASWWAPCYSGDAAYHKFITIFKTRSQIVVSPIDRIGGFSVRCIKN